LKVAEVAGDVPIVLRLHEGDAEQYLAHSWPDKWEIRVDRKMNLCDSLNWALKEYPRAKQYGFLADDTIPSPRDWAQRLQSAAGREYIAYPDDGIHGKGLCTHHCIGGDLMRRVGFWCLKGLRHNFLDQVWMTIGTETDRLRYVPSVKFDHLHPWVKKGPMDEVYALSASWFEKDQAIFDRWTQDGMQETCQRASSKG